MKFKIGDRVQFTQQALITCDPAISDDEMRGTIKGSEQDGDRLLIEFDDGKTEWWIKRNQKFEHEWFELEKKS